MPPRSRETRPRILALVTDAYGRLGGIAQYNRDFLDALESVATLTVVSLNPIDRTRSSPNMTLLDTRGSRWRFAAQALRQAIAGQPDIVVCGHLNLVHLANFVASTVNAKLWLQVHGIDAWQRPNRWRQRGTRHSDLITAVSRYTRAQLLAWSPIDPQRVRVLPNTVAERFRPDARDPEFRARFGLNQECTAVLLTVARLSKGDRYKGIDTIIEALPCLSVTHPGICYVVVGGGDDLPRLESLADSKGVRKSVKFLGPVDDSDLPQLYREADLFVMPSHKEGFGIVFVEAMASGIPALGLNVDGSIDALADGRLGYPVAPEDVVATIRTCLSTPAAPDQLAQLTRATFGRPLFQAHVARLVRDIIESRDATALAAST